MIFREVLKLKCVLMVCAVVGVGCHPKKKPRNPILKDKPEEVVSPSDDLVEPEIPGPSPTSDTPPARLKRCQSYKSGAVVCDHEWVGESAFRTIIAIHGMFPGNPRQLVRGIFGTDNDVRAFADRYRARIVVLGRPESLILWSYKDHLQDIVNIGRIYGEQSELYFFGHSNGGGLAGCAAAVLSTDSDVNLAGYFSWAGQDAVNVKNGSCGDLVQENAIIPKGALYVADNDRYMLDGLVFKNLGGWNSSLDYFDSHKIDFGLGQTTGHVTPIPSKIRNEIWRWFWPKK